jgi:ParB family chromosome partitioning protein
VIRLYRLLAEEDPNGTEESYAFQFEAPHFITLGLLYETNLRFAGGAFAPILRRVDKFLKGKLSDSLDERQKRAEMVREADRLLGAVVQKLKKRGLNHPFLKPYVLARTTPLTRARKTLPSFTVTFKKLAENLESFDVSKVRYEDVARSSIMVAAPEGE